MQQIAFTSEYYLRDKKDECDFLSVSTFICRLLIRIGVASQYVDGMVCALYMYVLKIEWFQ